MNRVLVHILLGIAMAGVPSFLHARQWTLQECINYALQNNISLKKTRLQKLSATEDYLQSKAALLPSLSASTSHGINYTPWVESGISSDGYSRSAVDKLYYNGSYGVNANLTLWNGNKNRNEIKRNKLAEEEASLDSAIQAQSIQEQIAQLYIQILYSTEAVEVNKESVKTSKTNEDRGKTMVDLGKMSKADLAQLTAQRAQDEYNVVAAESQVKNYKRQLKELLQLTTEEDFDIVPLEATDDMALEIIPSLNSVFMTALDKRPELKKYKNVIDQSELDIKIAKAGKMPTVSANAVLSTSTTSMNELAWASQMKSNLNAGAGFTVSIPIFDNRQTKTAVNKAMIQQESARFDLQNSQTTLFSTIENYWLQANTNQNQFKAAKVSSESAQASYDLLCEQFKLGLKNIVELMTGKDNLLTAKQNELQSKYLAILNIGMLKFYENGEINQ